MKKIWLLFILSLLVLPTKLCAAEVVNGDARPDVYLPLLEGKRVAVFSNHTGMVGDRHLVDVLKAEGVTVTVILSPEHGFRGHADAGETVSSTVDKAPGIPVCSLYGKQKVNVDSVLRQVDVLVTDIQDVGLRFYTYYITMYHLMDACAVTGTPMVLLDRPNPNGFYVDGPLLDMRHKSGVGALPIPVVHGMTLGELARMINGEEWLKNGAQCKLTVVPCLNYTHQTRTLVTVPPSPNLRTMKAIYLYPSICYFEGTVVSLGRGTDKPFLLYGHPGMKGYTFSFTPQSMPGAKNPPLLGQRCFGRDLSQIPDIHIQRQGLDLSYVIDAYRRTGLGDKFFTSFFENLIGVDYVRQMIKDGRSAKAIKQCWKADVRQFKQQRKPYLLYAE